MSDDNVMLSPESDDGLRPVVAALTSKSTSVTCGSRHVRQYKYKYIKSELSLKETVSK